MTNMPFPNVDVFYRNNVPIVRNKEKPVDQSSDEYNVMKSLIKLYKCYYVKTNHLATSIITRSFIITVVVHNYSNNIYDKRVTLSFVSFSSKFLFEIDIHGNDLYEKDYIWPNLIESKNLTFPKSNFTLKENVGELTPAILKEYEQQRPLSEKTNPIKMGSLISPQESYFCNIGFITLNKTCANIDFSIMNDLYFVINWSFSYCHKFDVMIRSTHSNKCVFFTIIESDGIFIPYTCRK